MNDRRNGFRAPRVALAACLVVGASVVEIAGRAEIAGAVPAPATVVSANAAGTPANVNAFSTGPQTASADGTKVVFASTANNLTGVAADVADTFYEDVYVKNRTTGAVTLASANGAGIKGNRDSLNFAISADGTHVAFVSESNNLDPADPDTESDVYLKDLTTGAVTLVSQGPSGARPVFVNRNAYVTLSYDGTKVAFSGLLEPADVVAGAGMLYVRDTVSGVTTRASTNMAGTKYEGGWGSLSGDGTTVAFMSRPQPWQPGCSCSQAIDGPIVAPPVDPAHLRYEVFVKDLTTGAVTRASTPAGGGRADGESQYPVLAADGSRVAFQSAATNLLPGDTDTLSDIYVRDLPGLALQLASVSTTGAKSTADAVSARLVGNGSSLVFTVYGGDNGLEPAAGSPAGMYHRDLSTGVTYLAAFGADGSISVDGSTIVSNDGQARASGPPSPSGVPDNIAPTISLGAPFDGATYSVGESVNASYSCADESGGSGLLSCVGTVPDGSAIDTSSAGTRAFEVTARDAAGNEAHIVARYDTDAPGPVVAIFSPTNGASYPSGQPVTANYSCHAAAGIDPVASCIGTVPNGDFVDTSLGTHVFSVTATDTSGRTTTETVTYQATALEVASQTVGSGGTVSTGSTPTPADPFDTAVTTPNGGTVSITEQANPSGLSGYSALGAQVLITAPSATRGNPLVLRFYGEGSALPPGIDHTNIALARNGAVLSNCLGATTVPATLVACISGRETAPSGGGDIVITVITTDASVWSLAARLPAVTPYLNVVAEGNASTTTARVPVSIPFAFDTAISVHFQTYDYSAKASGDFIVASGTVTFLPGETAATADVEVVGDTAIEPNEAFFVGFSAPVNATVGGYLGLGLGIIADDDHGGDVTTGYTAAEQTRTVQSALYLGMTPQQLQKYAVQLIAYVIAVNHTAPAPLVPVPDTSGPVLYTSTWTAGDVAALRAVETTYSLTAEQAQKFSVSVVNYVLAVQGH